MSDAEAAHRVEGIQQVSLADISPRRDLAYRDPLEQFPGAEALIASIARRGVLQPVLLNEGPEGLQIVAGFRRIDAARRTGLEWVPARLERRETSELFVVAVEEQVGAPLNLREQARAVEIARGLGFSPERIASELCAPLGLHPHTAIVDKVLRLRAIPPRLLELFVAKGFSLRQCLPFCAISPEEGEALAAVATHLGLGSRQLETATTWLQEISRREGVALTEVIHELELMKAWEAGRQGQAQREALGRLEERRFPETCARRKEVERLCVELGDELQVRYDRNFSRDAAEVSFQAGSLEQLDRSLELIGSARVRGLLAEIFERLAC